MAAQLAVAQTETESKKMVGPFNLSGDIGAEYTDNRDATVDEESNVDYFIRPRLDALFETDKGLLDLYYAPRYRYRSDPSDIQNESELFHDAGLRARLKLTPSFQPWIRDNFKYTDDPEVTEEGAVLRRDSSYSANEVLAGFNYNFSRRLAATIDGRYYTKRYEDELVAEASDETQAGGSVSLWRSISRTVGVLAEAKATTYDYEDISDFERGFNVIVGSLGIQKVLHTQLRAGVNVGYGQADFEEDALGEKNFPYANINVLGKYPPFSEIRGWASHRMMESDVYPFASQQNTDIGVRAKFDVPKSLILSFSSRYALGHYDRDFLPDDAVATARDTEGDEEVVVLSGTVGYRITRDMSLKLTQTYEDVDSDVDISYDRNSSKLVFTKNF
jgi:hypothetical protein